MVRSSPIAPTPVAPYSSANINETGKFPSAGSHMVACSMADTTKPMQKTFMMPLTNGEILSKGLPRLILAKTHTLESPKKPIIILPITTPALMTAEIPAPWAGVAPP